MTARVGVRGRRKEKERGVRGSTVLPAHSEEAQE